ncbi:MAG: PcfJ domain-containing protein, partial [Oscillibacter sp.]|nr:PcfJ domain-containing protein [Oscillibacter sp.]
RSRKEREKQEAKRIAENAKYTAQFAELAERLAPLSWEYKGILIRCAAAPGELDEEGRALSHCVGGYKDTHAKGEKPIFFIRRAKEPDKPWYTLQLDLIKRTVIQNRGKCNCKETKAVVEFREQWVEHIQSVRLPAVGKRQRVRVRGAV